MSGAPARQVRSTHDDRLVSDIHAQLNQTAVAEIVRPRSIGEIRAAIHRAAVEARAVSIYGGQHAIGGQQIGAGTILLDMSSMDRVVELDPTAGEIEVRAGMQWPVLIASLIECRSDRSPSWGIIQALSFALLHRAVEAAAMTHPAGETAMAGAAVATARAVD